VSRQVIHDGAGSLQVRFSFDRRLVDLVKGLSSRRWNPAEKFWSVPEAGVVELVDLLRREGFQFCETTRRLYAERGGLPGLFDAPADAPGDPQALPGAEAATASDFTVSKLNETVRAALEAAFPLPIWIVGEISGFNKSAHKRIVTFHLVERDEHGKSVAEVAATLFEPTRRDLERRLAAAGQPFQLEDEITVRMRARVELYVPWGSYRVIVEELDVAYTLGEAARRREEIVRKLTEEGIIDRNRSLPFPDLPLRVGLVTSLGSDAFNDVLRTLQESGFAFDVTAHGARVQGRQTEPSILNALDWFRARAESLDVVLVCRGGGSRTDLAWLDSEALARAVALFPIPVVVGIGHEQDLSALDAVGWRSKTPTAAAAFLVERVGAALDRVERAARVALEAAGRSLRDVRREARERALRLARTARGLLDRETSELGHRRRRTVRGSRALLQSASVDLARRHAAIPRAATLHLERSAAMLTLAARRLGQGARRDIVAARSLLAGAAALVGPRSLRLASFEAERAEARARRLHLVDPRRVVERGYAIVRSAGGKVLTDAAGAPAGARLRAELRKGSIRMTSEGPEES
jgi:exodeoxyribonuclease VII large subunit